MSEKTELFSVEVPAGMVDTTETIAIQLYFDDTGKLMSKGVRVVKTDEETSLPPSPDPLS